MVARLVRVAKRLGKSRVLRERLSALHSQNSRFFPLLRDPVQRCILLVRGDGHNFVATPSSRPQTGDKMRIYMAYDHGKSW